MMTTVSRGTGRGFPVVGSVRVPVFQRVDWGNVRAAAAEFGKLAAAGLVMGGLFYAALVFGCREDVSQRREGAKVEASR